MPINNMNPEGLVKEIKIKNKNQAYKRRWKEPLFLDNNKPQVSLENGLFLMPNIRQKRRSMKKMIWKARYKTWFRGKMTDSF